MAAAIVAIRKNSTAAGFTPEEGININEDLTDEDCIKSGMLHRKSLSERGHWFPRFVILTWNELTFCKVSEDGKRSRVDHIPLHEIVLVSIQDMEDDEDNAFSFVIHVVEDGRDNGRPAFLKAESRQEMDEWVALIRHHSRAEIERLEAQEDTMPFAKERRIVRQFYASDKAQIIFGGVIVVSYGFAIIESEMRPEDGSSLSTTLFVFEALFTTIFGIELVINLFGNWLYPFFRSPWNVFDAFVVFISVLGLSVDELPGARPTSFSSPAPRACARMVPCLRCSYAWAVVFTGSRVAGLGVLRLVRVFKLVRLAKTHMPQVHANASGSRLSTNSLLAVPCALTPPSAQDTPSYTRHRKASSDVPRPTNLPFFSCTFCSWRSLHRSCPSSTASSSSSS